MAELIDSIQRIIGNYVNEIGLTDMVVGTVTKDNPLEVTIESTMLPIPADLLLKTSAVIPKTLTINGHIHQINTLSHSHSYSDDDGTSTTTKTTGEGLTGSYASLPAMENIVCLENGVQLPIAGNVVTINRGLIVGDKVLLLRVLDGQKFIILSRIFE